MHKDENNAIRYLMKEMDPSEEMEFEKRMREDENLLIEVESLRATKRRLSNLPLKNPPKHVTQNIANDLNKLQSKKFTTSFNVTSYLKLGAAAVVLLTGISGALYYYSITPLQNVQPTVKSAGQIEPWVDRNEVLRFQVGSQTAEGEDIKQDLNQSYEKLQLVNDPANSGSSEGILLTGSPK